MNILLIARCSLLSAHCSLLSALFPLLLGRCSLAVTFCLLLIPRFFQLVTFSTLLITFCSLLASVCSLSVFLIISLNFLLQLCSLYFDKFQSYVIFSAGTSLKHILVIRSCFFSYTALFRLKSVSSISQRPVFSGC